MILTMAGDLTNLNGSHAVILFDGECGLCDRSVRFAVRHDSVGVFRVAPRESAVGRRLLAERGIDPQAIDSMVLIDGERSFVRSDATMQILSKLDRPWRWLSVLRFVPRCVRDMVYKCVAALRYRMFGKADVCEMAPPELRERMLIDPVDLPSDSGVS